jgi:glycosyltransferase involved in cell wall biosynthesis
MSTNPTISVIIPVYNRTKSCVAAASSVLSQRDVEFELIVVDDGSTEATAELEALLRETDAKFYSLPHAGVSSARNFGVSVSSGKWIAFLDSDDEWESNKLFKQLEYHRHNPSCLISQSAEIWLRNGVRVNPKLKHAQAKGYAFERSLELCCISPSAVFMSKQLFTDAGGFDQKMRICEDYDLWLRLTANNSIGLQDKPLVIKRGGHADQLSRSEVALDRFRIYAMLKLLSGGTQLNASQIDLCYSMFQRKLEVLIQGAKKRSHQRSLLMIYSKLQDMAEVSNVDYEGQGRPASIRQHCRKLLPEAEQLLIPVLKE